MSADMKHSPLCSRDGGREVFFTVRYDDAKYRLTTSRAFLDDTCGDTATETRRKAWVKQNLSQILAVLTARTGGNAVTEPFNRVLVEEIN